MDDGLFRREAMRAQQRSWLGVVRLPIQVTHGIWACSAGCIGAIIIAWLLLGHYTRREHVSGNLVPQAGLIDVTAHAAGVITEVRTTEGGEVRAGDPLVVLSGELTSASLGDAHAEVSAQLHIQAMRLEADLIDTRRLADKQTEGLQAQQALLQSQLVQIDAQLGIEQRQVESYNKLLDRIRPLVAKGYVSAFQVQDQEAQALSAEGQVKGLSRQRYETAQQLSTITDQWKQLPLTTAAKLNELSRQLAQVKQSLAQNEAARAVVLRAVHDGTVSSLLVKPGQSVSVGQVLAAIVPKDSPLQAQLLVPSSAIGFVRPGTEVSLHYQAFPYQKFGVQHGIVQQVSRSALTPSEITALMGQQPPQEALYRVQVNLQKQTIIADGQVVALKPGMALDASLLLDRRRLIEWMFEPLYGMRRRAEGDD